ncbi:MAG: hypothetical protein AVDCRST_MAG67-849 [uncultured Solirubrobacteraceae bacterium]|uniref:Uncharacterized protein n=1 Tax=uncultured Solirubrobacteraceae bacterium TaxID=1162706 RepID=A0A6J4RS17_9ACTN|nr:MAG: hypothetical protein AVDCRST_MAG67-849 [uncultured Solirubrobacteraceae bacterium]
MTVSPRRSRITRALTRVAMTVAIGAAGAFAAPAAAAPQPPDYHSNCTAGFAAGSAYEGSPGAVGSVARPPKQFGSMSDVGFYSRTNCG